MGRILLTLCGLVVALGLSGAQASGQVQRGGAEQATTEEQAQTTDDRALADIARAIERAARNPHEQEEQRRSQRDLEAQQAMAKLTLWVTIAAFLQVIVALIGIHYLRKTIEETRRAADLTIAEATRTTAAANASLEHAKAASYAELRAYVFLSGSTINRFMRSEREVAGYDLAFDFQNTGQTPAYRVTGYLNHAFFPGPPPKDFDYPDSNTGDVSLSTLGPGQKSQLSRQIAVEEFGDLKRPRLFVWGWMEYDDAFPDTPRHRSEICFEIEILGDPRNPDAPVKGFHGVAFNGADDDCLRQPQRNRPAGPAE